MLHTFSTRWFFHVLLFLAAVFLTAVPSKADFPSKPVTIIVPFGPGGATDQSARIIAERFQARLGQPVIVMNRPGAGGIIGSDYVAKSQPDGYTLLLTTAGTFGGLQSSGIITSVPYDMHKDFDHVTLIGWTPRAMAVSAKAPFRSVTDLVSYAKDHPNRVSYSMVPGTIEELAMKVFQINSQTQLNPVAYAAGAGKAMVDLLAGHVPVIFVPLPALNAAGDGAKIIAVTSPTRLRNHPNVPTFAELGMPNLTFRSYVGIAVPAGTPTKVIAALNQALVATIRHPEIVAKLDQVGIEAAGTSPDETSRSVTDIATFILDMSNQAKKRP